MSNTLSSHFQDLRITLIKSLSTVALGALFAFWFSKELFLFLTQDVTLIATSPLEGFLATFKIAFYSGLIFTSPLWIYFLVQFLLPALHEKEKRWVMPTLVTLFAFGCSALYVAIKWALPLATTFFSEYNAPIAQNLWSVSSYLSFVITLSFSLLIGSQLVGLFFLLVHFGVFSYAQLSQHRKKAVLGAFILGALLTPPDVPSQVVMAAFLIGAFELILLYSRIKRRRPRDF